MTSPNPEVARAEGKHGGALALQKLWRVPAAQGSNTADMGPLLQPHRTGAADTETAKGRNQVPGRRPPC